MGHDYGIIKEEIAKINYEKFRNLNLFELIALGAQFPNLVRIWDISSLGITTSGYFGEGCALTLTDSRIAWHIISDNMCGTYIFRRKFAFALSPK